MNLPRIGHYGLKFINTFKQSIPVFTALRVVNLSLPPSTPFSSFCNRISECTKLTLASYNPLLLSSRGIKVRGSLQLRCKNCYFERKDGVLYVMCPTYRRHKQRQLTKREKYTWILTHCSQSRKRLW